ncbi:MAG: hypothetical protein ACK41E_03470 [Deinococcales bacterium]
MPSSEPSNLRAILHRCRDVLLEVKITLERMRNSTVQRRLYADWVALETSQGILSPDEYLHRAEALRLEVSDLYARYTAL